jgi:hypothetical protein
MAPGGMLHNSLHLTQSCGHSGLEKNMEFSQDIRELKFPVTGSSSKKFC